MAKVAVLRCNRYNSSVFKTVSRALDIINAKELFKKEKKVLIKPNILASAAPSKAITTHPSVIEAVIRYLKNLDVKIFIGESSGSGAAHGTSKAFKASGIKKVADKYDIKFINFDEDKHVVKHVDSNKIMKNIVMSKTLNQIDLIIDVCKLKTHMLTGYTGAVKNMFGILPGRAKINAHTKGKNIKAFSNIILDIYCAAKPHLCIMDGIIGMQGNGPSGGKIKQTGIIAASKDGIALDIIISKIIGFKFNDLEFLRFAEKRNLIPKKIEVIGEKYLSIPYIKPVSYRFGHFKHIHRFIMKHMQTAFKVDKNKCKRCGYCIRACPEKAISIKKGFPKWNKRKCIMCYCCHELCPHDAVILKKPLIARIADLVIKRFKD